MLQVKLLGQFDVRADGKRVLIQRRAGQSLFAYLILTAGTPHRREKLAGLFWPDISDETARRNLRQELWRVRKALSAQSPTAEYFLAEEISITFNPHSEYRLDAAQLERPSSADSLNDLINTAALYQGELLPGFYDDWIVLERERVRALFEARMRQLLEWLTREERWTAVQEWAEKWLAFGEAPEPAYRALMLAYGARGDMAKVAAIYKRCIDDLRDELGVEASAETRALYDGLLKGAHAPVRTPTVQPSATVTFLFSDIEGSTNLLDTWREQYATMLAEHHALMRAAFQKWNGREVDTQGDAFFVSFTRALDGVQCAVEAQRSLAAHAWPPGARVRVRMGLHTGEPLVTSTGYVGMDVHRAARIGEAGHGGQVLLSQTTRELVMHDLPNDVMLKDLGEYRLKDMKFPTSIYQLAVEGLQNDFPPLKSGFSGTDAPSPGEPPFKGLQNFDEADAEWFFGREELTEELVSRIRESQFLSVIIGASGSGKSSLARAGLIPALKKAMGKAGSGLWRVHVITPTAHPLEALAAELTRQSESVTATATLTDDLSKDPRSLYLFLRRQATVNQSPSGISRPPTLAGRLLLVVDQFEELFTLCRDEFEREAFIDNLLSVISGDGKGLVTLVITLRADFYPHLAQYPELREAVAQAQKYIGPMTTQELRRAMEGPARRGHWEFEPGLVDLILRDVGDEPGALPLLSHALFETWKRRSGRTMTLKGYAESGGVRGAIASSAGTVYSNLSPEQQVIARDIFVRLTELGEGTEDTRRRVALDELLSQAERADDVRAVLTLLADARLITTAEGTAEVAHEALIREWPLLREWLTEDRQGLQLHRHLTEAAHEWELLERDKGALYQGARLAQAREWTAANANALNPQERVFLEASIAESERQQAEEAERQRRELQAARTLAETEKRRADEQMQSARRLGIRNRMVTAVGGIAVLLALLASMFGLQSKQNATQAQTNLSLAQANATVARANLTRSEAQRLAAEASALLKSNGSSELAALLAIRSMQQQYSAEGDAALSGAAELYYPQRYFDGHAKFVSSVAFSPNGKYVLTGGADHTARLWDTDGGKELRQFVHDDWVFWAVFSPDGRRAVTLNNGYDFKVRFWDVETGALVRELHNSDFTDVAVFSPDGKYLFTGSRDATVRVWDVQTGEIVRSYQLPAPASIVRFVSADGRYALTTPATGNTVQLWSLGVPVTKIQEFAYPDKPTWWAFAMSPDSKQVLIGYSAGAVVLWDAATGASNRIFKGHLAWISSVAFSPDGRYVLTGSQDKSVRLWDANTGQELKRLTGSDQVYTAVFSPDGRSVLVGSGDGTVELWDLHALPEHPVFKGHSGIVSTVAVSPDGKILATGGTDGVQIWDSGTGDAKHTLNQAGLVVYGLRFSPDGRYLLSGSESGVATLWDAETGQMVRRFSFSDSTSINDAAFSPDGRFVVAGGLNTNHDHDVQVWDVQTGSATLRLQVPVTDQVTRVAFSPDGQSILTAHGLPPVVRLWDTKTGQELRQFAGHTDLVNGAAFSPDGKTIATASYDKTTRLWDAQTGEEIRRFVGHTGGVLGVAFSPNGQFLATGSGDGTARLWDVETGHELRRFAGHAAGVETVVFSPDGRFLATASDDGTAKLWDVDYTVTIRYLCSRLLRDFTDAERAQYNITDPGPTCK